MSRDDDDTNAFIEQLKGKQPTDGHAPSPGIAQLRDALQAQIDTQRTAEKATVADFDQQELERMAELKQLLIDRGLLGSTNTKKISRITPSRLLQRLSDTLHADNWYRPLAMAASLVLVIGIVVMIVLPPNQDQDTVRGSDTTPVLVVADPQATIETLTKQLEQAGAEVLPVQINDHEWSLQIDVPSKVEATAIQNILNNYGVKVEGLPPYHLLVKKS